MWLRDTAHEALRRSSRCSTTCRKSALRQWQEVVREEVKEIAWKQQHRFLARNRNLTARGKNKGQVITAIGRELVGFHLGHRKTAVGFSFVYKR